MSNHEYRTSNIEGYGYYRFKNDQAKSNLREFDIRYFLVRAKVENHRDRLV